MAKRFTDTEKWKKVWFRKLTPNHKCFWQYLIDNCNHAGIWDVDFELASIFIGTTLDEKNLRSTFSKQFKELSNGKKWLVVDFIDFQYGPLNPDNRAHKSVIDILNKEGAYKGLIRSLQGRKDMDMDKDKDMDKEKEKNYTQDFLDFWELYPKKVGKKNTYDLWKKLTKQEKELALEDIPKRHTDRKWIGGFIKDPERYIKNKQWEDEITQDKPSKPRVLKLNS